MLMFQLPFKINIKQLFITIIVQQILLLINVYIDEMFVMIRIF